MARVGEGPERREEPQRALAVGLAAHRPVRRRTHLPEDGDALPQHLGRPGLLGVAAVGVGHRGHVVSVHRVAQLPLAALDQALAGVVAQRLEHLVAGDPVHAPAVQQRALDEPVEQVEQLVLVHPITGAHGERRVEVRPAGHHRQAFEHQLLALVEQPVGPLDRALERAVALVSAPARTGQEREVVVEAVGDLQRRERAHARGRQLQRERQAVEPAADASHGRGVGGIDAEAPVREPRAVEEHRACLGAGRPTRACRRPEARVAPAPPPPRPPRPAARGSWPAGARRGRTRARVPPGRPRPPPPGRSRRAPAGSPARSGRRPPPAPGRWRRCRGRARRPPPRPPPSDRAAR